MQTRNEWILKELIKLMILISLCFGFEYLFGIQFFKEFNIDTNYPILNQIVLFFFQCSAKRYFLYLFPILFILYRTPIILKGIKKRITKNYLKWLIFLLVSSTIIYLYREFWLSFSQKLIQFLVHFSTRKSMHIASIIQSLILVKIMTTHPFWEERITRWYGRHFGHLFRIKRRNKKFRSITKVKKCKD